MAENVIISVDAMGGDNAPDIVISGIETYLKDIVDEKPPHFLLHGDNSVLMPLLAKTPFTAANSTVEHTDAYIDMNTKPSHALRRGKGTSMWNAIESVKNGEAQVGLSAGNTGGFMAMSSLQLRTKSGVQRPALAATWPSQNGLSVVLDVGANVESDATQLTEFAVMGDAYYRALFNTDRPTIGLLNVGVEENKGNATVKAAHARLMESELGLNYVGYVEGNDISNGNVDVIVTDGFTGNVALKTAEGTAQLIQTIISDSLRSTAWSRFASALNYQGFKRVKSRIDPRKVNGAVFLGLNGIVVKSHGGTDAIGFANAVNIAAELAKSDFMDELDRALAAFHIEDDNIGFLP